MSETITPRANILENSHFIGYSVADAHCGNVERQTFDAARLKRSAVTRYDLRGRESIDRGRNIAEFLRMKSDFKAALSGAEIRPWPFSDAEFARGQRWEGPAGHVLQFGEDGNLALLNPAGEVVWESGTARLAPAKVVLRTSGEFAICDWRGYPVWSTPAAPHPGSYLVLQPDGNLVLYSDEGVPLWETGTAGR